MTYGVVLFTLLAQGLTMAEVARRLGLTAGATPAGSSRTRSLEALAE